MSTAIRFRFLVGRYHSTPWGAHVNEAALEWPPSPWRVLRSLVAVWHRKVDPSEVAEQDLDRLIAQMARSTPQYRVPPAVHTHTRHYMPTRAGRSEKRTLIFDAFARLRPDDDLIVVWPQVDLNETARGHLALLLDRLGYLGRAESWVEAALLASDWIGEVNCWPVADPNGRPAGHGLGETLALPTPVDPDEYRAWRDIEVTARNLDRSKLGARDRRLLATLPERLVDSLRLDTAEIRDQGWSRHPGMRFVRYRRPADTFGLQARTTKGLRARESMITTVRLILRGKPMIPRGAPLPMVEDAIRIGEAVRAAAMSRADRKRGDDDIRIPPVLSGHGMGEDNIHEHAFYLPEDADRDGRIDHILVHAAAGLSRTAVDALTVIDRVWLDSDQEWGVIFDAAGSVEGAAPGQSLWGHPYLGPSESWVSVTPYLHPWYRKKKFGIEAQIRRECRERGLPEPTLERLDTIPVRGRARRPVHFHRFRTRARRRASQPDSRGSFWRLTFPAPVSGPLALGFGCHFGLGIFTSL